MANNQFLFTPQAVNNTSTLGSSAPVYELMAAAAV